MIVTAAPDLIPPPLINQLKAGGRMVIPVGLPDAQQLLLAEKDLNGRIATKEISRYCSRCWRVPTSLRFGCPDQMIAGRSRRVLALSLKCGGNALCRRDRQLV